VKISTACHCLAKVSRLVPPATKLKAILTMDADAALLRMQLPTLRRSDMFIAPGVKSEANETRG